jgi:hypothetical protein
LNFENLFCNEFNYNKTARDAQTVENPSSKSGISDGLAILREKYHEMRENVGIFKNKTFMYVFY